MAQTRLLESYLWSSWGMLSDCPAHSPLRGPTKINATFSKYLTIPTRMFEVPIFSSSIINKDHEDESYPVKQERTCTQGLHR